MPARNLLHELSHHPDFMVAGLSSSERIYRLCWAFNSNLNTAFTKIEDYSVILPREKEASYFPLYLDDNPELGRMIYLLANKSANKLLLPEWAPADYLLVFQGEFTQPAVEGLLEGLRQQPWVQTCFFIKRKQIKSIKNLAF